MRHGVCFRRLFHIFCYHIPHRRNDILSGKTEKSPHVLFRTHNPTGNYFSVYSRCLPIAPAPNTASAHKGIGTDPNVNHHVPMFLFSTIYPIVSHSYLYYLTCAFINKCFDHRNYFSHISIDPPSRNCSFCSLRDSPQKSFWYTDYIKTKQSQNTCKNMILIKWRN